MRWRGVTLERPPRLTFTPATPLWRQRRGRQ